MDNLGKRIKLARETYPGGEMTQKELGDAAGISQTTVADIERGRNKGTKHIVALAKALKVAIEWLNDNKGEMRPNAILLASTEQAFQSGAVHAVDDDEDNPNVVRVRKVKLKISAGITGFATEPDEGDGNPIYFCKSWMVARGYKQANLIAITVKGDSMEPGLFDGDIVVVNTADTTPKDGEAFAINYEGEPIVKRMVRDSGSWWLSSDNQDKSRHPLKLCAGEACIMIGRIVNKQSERI